MNFNLIPHNRRPSGTLRQLQSAVLYALAAIALTACGGGASDEPDAAAAT